jgi:hypothetical protein
MMIQVFCIDFEDPPETLITSKICSTLWWVSAKVRSVLTSQQWIARVYNGQTPHFCLYKRAFCRYYETRAELEDHYEKHPDHRLTPDEFDVYAQDAKMIKYLRQWDFPEMQRNRRSMRNQDPETDDDNPMVQCKVLNAQSAVG